MLFFLKKILKTEDMENYQCPLSMRMRLFLALFVFGIALSIAVCLKTFCSEKFSIIREEELSLPLPPQGELISIPKESNLTSPELFPDKSAGNTQNGKTHKVAKSTSMFTQSDCVDQNVCGTSDRIPPLSSNPGNAGNGSRWPSSVGTTNNELTAGFIRYKTKDNDTLDGLAERFLGDKNRASEIYEYNRDRLLDRNIIPVDIILIIPSARKPGDK